MKPPILVCSLLLFASVSCRAQAQEAFRPVIEDGQSQAVEAFSDPDTWIKEELWVETEFDSDGDGKLDRMHVAVTRQGQTESEGLKVAVIYGTSPYYAGTSGTLENFWDIRHELGEVPPARIHQAAPKLRAAPGISNGFIDEWVPRGFAVVHSSSPGTGLSQGCPTTGGTNETLAPKAVIDWLNGRAMGYTTPDGDQEVSADWSTGKVGMTGTSYNATLPVAAATTGVEGLEAIIPVAPVTSWYHYYRSNGLVRNPAGYPGEDVDVLYDFVHSRESGRREYCDETYRDGEMARGQDRVTGDYNEFWAGRDYLNMMDNYSAATLMSHAFNDWNVVPEHSARLVAALKERGVPVQQYYHQGGHGGAPPHRLMNRWFTRYLYGVENGVEDDPGAWIVRGDDDRQEPTPYEDYPNPEASGVTLFPSGDGIGIGQLSRMQFGDPGPQTLTDNVSFDGQTLAGAEWTEHRLLYATPVLSQDAHVSGTVKVHVRVSGDRPAMNLSVWLVSLPWTEGRRPRGGLITRGWADPQNHDSISESEPLIPGEFYDLSFDLQPDDQIIAAGQQIGLMIMSSDREFTLRPRPGTQMTVDLGATSISLPVVGGRLSFEEQEGRN